MHAIIILEYWKEIREGCNRNLDIFFSSHFLTINFAVNSKAEMNLITSVTYIHKKEVYNAIKLLHKLMDLSINNLLWSRLIGIYYKTDIPWQPWQ